MLSRLKNAFIGKSETQIKRRMRAIECLTVILCLIMLLTSATYSWIRRKWSPQITQEGIKIMAGEALTFSLIGSNLGINQNITLNEIMNLDNFALMPVSNFSGESDDFFKLNTNVFEDEYFSHITQEGTATAEGWTALGLANGYIEQSFMIQGKDARETSDNYTKWVYLTDESHISINRNVDDEKQREAYKAIRCSLTWGEGASQTTVIFMPEANRSHVAINNLQIDGVWIADGVRYRATTEDGDNKIQDRELRLRKTKFAYSGTVYDIRTTNTTGNVMLFSDKMGGFNNGGTTFQESAALFSISQGQTMKITVRIWLEGEDYECYNGIKASLIDFLIGFESYNVTEGTSGETTQDGEVTTEEETERE